MISVKRVQYWQKKLSRLREKYKIQVHRNMSLRLGFGLLGLGLLVVMALLKAPLWLIVLWFLDLGYFIYLVLVYRNLNRFIHKLSIVEEFFQRQEMRVEGLFSQAKAFSPTIEGELDILSQDFHLFGEKSIFEFIDESFTPYGKNTLFEWFKGLDNPNLESIHRRQKMWQQWRPFLWRFLSLKVMGERNRESFSSSIIDLDRSLVNPKFFRYFKVQSVLLITMWTLVILGGLGISPLSPVLPVVAYLLFILTTRSEAHSSFFRAQDLSQQIQALVPLLRHIEMKFKDSPFTSHFEHLHRSQFSQKSKKLQFLISLLSVQAHGMAHIAVNLFLPWEHLITIFVERWRVSVAKELPLALKELGEFEALMSLCFMSHFQTSCQAHISDKVALKFEGLYHPLIPREQVVKNDFELKSQLVLLTGSNMAGKSTFLRTVGVNHALAMLGAPVYAGYFQSFCAPMLSCLKVSDSLQDGYSKFYYEVIRISQILKLAQSKKTFLYFIDEIFNGTNNQERLKGSQTVIKEIVGFSQVLGFISSHDLELSKMEKDFPQMSNWHFRDEAKDNQLVFNYLIQKGPCPTTNALKIMLRAGIPVGD